MNRQLLFAGALTLATALPALSADLTNMSDAERDAFRAEVRAYLLDNPEVIFEAVAIMEQRESEAKQQNDLTLVQVNEQEIFEDGYSWSGGNPEGDIRLVEFIDYRCGYCRRAHDEVAELVNSDGNIRITIKEFPILGEDSMASSRFAIAVKHIAGDDSYDMAKDMLIALKSEASEPALRRLAAQLGVDADAVIARMSHDDVTREIQATRSLAQRLSISGTPTFVLEGSLIRGYVPLEQMRAMVAEQRDLKG